MRVLWALCGLLLVSAAPASAPVKAMSCDASYPDYCIPPPPPDLNCPDITGRKPFRVRRPDPHGFDRDHDGWGCEPRPKPHALQGAG